MPIIMGVYKIENTETGKVYIGSSVNIKRRLSGHLGKLGLGNHCNPYLQNSWNKHGEVAFEFSIIEKVEDKNNLIDKEQQWMDYYRCYEREHGYNMLPVAGSCLGYTQSKESKRKKSEALKGIPLSEKTKQRMSKAKRGTQVGKNNPFYGKSHSIEHREKMGVVMGKDWIVTDPDENEDIIHNLEKFCREKKLSSGLMNRVAKGKRSHHKGWKCRKVNDEE